MAAARFRSRRTRREKRIAQLCCAWRLTFPMNSYHKILYAVEQGIARITLNRPEKRNALDAELISEVKDAVRACARDESVRVVLIGGAGTGFYSGADLSGLPGNAGADLLKNMDDPRNMAARFIDLPHPPRPNVLAVPAAPHSAGQRRP